MGVKHKTKFIVHNQKTDRRRHESGKTAIRQTLQYEKGTGSKASACQMNVSATRTNGPMYRRAMSSTLPSYTW